MSLYRATLALLEAARRAIAKARGTAVVAEVARNRPAADVPTRATAVVVEVARTYVPSVQATLVVVEVARAYIPPPPAAGQRFWATLVG